MNSTELVKSYTTPDQISATYDELKKASDPQVKKKQKTKRVISVFTSVIFVSFLVMILMLVINVRMVKDQGESPNILGFSVYSVKSGSMIPTLPIGSVFLSKQYKGQELEVGTIVTFQNKEGKRISHRIIEKLTDESGNLYYRTKGDNPNNSPDIDPLYPAQIEAVFVTRLHLFG